jgi:hypothetical protein
MDDNTFPHKVRLIRGSARLETVTGIVPEYAKAAARYLGIFAVSVSQRGKAWVEQPGSIQHLCGYRQAKQSPGVYARALFWDCLTKLSRRRPLTSALQGPNGLSHLADQEGLEIWLIAGPFQADNRVPLLAVNEIALSVGAGYFKLAGLTLQSFGNIVGCNSVV